MDRNFTTYPLLALLILLSFGFDKPPVATVIYVDQDATAGVNDGSSWANAFVDLQYALAAAAEGDIIWVAEGVYLPATLGGNTASTFHISQNIQLYGGFSGTEASLDERDPDNHLTILSGDLNGNDIPGDLDSNRADNVMTILLVDANVNSTTILDGFTFRQGHAAGNDSLFYNRRGGGIFSFGSPLIRQCRFVENYGDRGGGLYLHGPAAAGTVIDNCFFERNGAEEGAAFMAFYVDSTGVSVVDCQFEENQATSWGGAIRVYNSNCAVSGSIFMENTSKRGGGAVEIRSIVDHNETVLANCVFTQNQSRQGGAVRFQTNSGLGSHHNKLNISDCTFSANEAIAVDTSQMGSRAGGAIHANIERTANSGMVWIEDCDFTGNHSEQNAAAILAELEGVAYDFQLKACVFTGNIAGESGIVNLAASEVGAGHAQVESCLFQNNVSAARSGGLVIGGARSVQATFSIMDCAFSENTVTEWGGGLTIYCRDTAAVIATIESCEFSGNSAQEKGGAVFTSANNDQLTAVFRKCIFRANQSPYGAAVSMGKWPATGTGTGSSCLFDNCLFYENSGEGVIHCDTCPALICINNTVANNQAGTFWRASAGVVSLQNNILFNPGYSEYTSPASTEAVVSLGGNILGDSSLDAVLSAADHSGVDPVFVNTGPYPFQLYNQSPAINKGTDPVEIPDTDLAGNPRIQNGCIDAGSYESAFVAACFSGTEEKVLEKVHLFLWPNPAGETVTVEMEDIRDSTAHYHVVNALGQISLSGIIENAENNFSRTVDISDLPPGVYHFILFQQGLPVGKRFVKN